MSSSNFFAPQATPHYTLCSIYFWIIVTSSKRSAVANAPKHAENLLLCYSKLKVLFLDKKLVNNEFNEKFRQNLIELQLVCYFLNFHAPLRLHEIDQHATQLIHFDF